MVPQTSRVAAEIRHVPVWSRLVCPDPIAFPAWPLCNTMPAQGGSMPYTINLSDAALALLRRRLSGEWVEVNEETRPIYRELVASGLMYAVSGFTHGPEANFRFTEAGWALRPFAGAAPRAGSS